MNSRVQFSVIIPTMNRASILERCLQSLAAQNYTMTDFEVIVIDNDSFDNTKQVVAKIAQLFPQLQLKYLFHKKHGATAARHLGVEHARYEILSFLDDDGLVCSDWLLSVNETFVRYPDACAVAGKIEIMWDAPPPGWIFQYEHMLGKLDLGPDCFVAKNLFLNGGNMHVRRKKFLELGGFNVDLVGEILVGDGDRGFSLKLHKDGAIIAWCPTALMSHYQVVSKHGTVEDMSRRFANDAISMSYAELTAAQRDYVAISRSVGSAVIRSSLLTLLQIYHVVRRNEYKRINARLRRDFHVARLKYVARYVVSPKFRREVHGA